MRFRQVDHGFHPHGFACVADHRLLDRTVVLHPVKPWCVPNEWEANRAGNRMHVPFDFHLIGKHLVTNPIQSVKPGEALCHTLFDHFCFKITLFLGGIKEVIKLPLKQAAILWGVGIA